MKQRAAEETNRAARKGFPVFCVVDQPDNHGRWGDLWCIHGGKPFTAEAQRRIPLA